MAHKAEMHARHHKERQAMHTKHEAESKLMGERHDQEMGGMEGPAETGAMPVTAGQDAAPGAA